MTEITRLFDEAVTLIAQALHRLSKRQSFIEVNCAALPAELAESEFFGHVRGAFTDARDGRSGLVTDADGGTLPDDILQ